MYFIFLHNRKKIRRKIWMIWMQSHVNHSVINHDLKIIKMWYCAQNLKYWNNGNNEPIRYFRDVKYTNNSNNNKIIYNNII